MPRKGHTPLPEVRARIAATLRAHHEATKGERYVENEDGCWIWQWATRGRGYPSQGQRQGIYQRERGVYPKGFALHHECGVKRCVNPAHQVPMPRPMHVELHRYLTAKGFRDLDVADRITLSRVLWEAREAVGVT